jgi:hypothetical protein
MGRQTETKEEYLETYEWWRQECVLARQEVTHLREKIVELIADRDAWKRKVKESEQSILRYLSK